MRSRKKKAPSDPNQLAAFIVERATAEPAEQKPEKNPAAVALGRLGGLKGGKARAAALSAKRRKEIAQKAIAARWEKATKAPIPARHKKRPLETYRDIF
jgi:hypothetical protein